MIKAFFWDNDGVLVDTERFYYRATKEVLATVGISLTAVDYVELFLRQAKGAWHLAEEKGFSPEAITRLRERRNAVYGELITQQHLVIDDVEEVLRALHGKYRMSIVTSSRKEHFELIHRSTGLLKYFDFVIAHGDYTRFKPDPEPYRKALERTGFKEEECLVVEDSERGLISAMAAGLKCIIIPNQLTRDSPFRGAYRVVSSVREIPSILTQMCLTRT